MNVDRDCMANAGERLAGPVPSGLGDRARGRTGWLWWSAGVVLGARGVSLSRPGVGSAGVGPVGGGAEIIDV
jgi:hypothetical protein